MGGNLLVINVDLRETRVALIESGIIAELHIERHASRSTLGNVYLGTVSRVLPGMQAAFIDIGQERAAFLHVEDLIRPDDFDAYLAGTRQVPTADEADVDAAAEAAGEGDASGVEADSGRASADVAGTDTEASTDETAPVADSDEPAEAGPRRMRRARVPRSGQAKSAKTTKASRSRRTVKTTAPEAKAQPRKTASKKKASSRRRARAAAAKSKTKEPRISKSTPIREVVREGQQVVVQVCKEPIGTKGARVTSHISLPGRYVVYLPTVEHVGISKRIGADKERGRLREAIDSVKPPTGGLVVRTVAEGLTKKKLKADVGYLVRVWEELSRKREQAPKAPCLLYEELDLVLKTARDLFTEDVDQIVIDDREQHGRLRRFVEMFLPDRVESVVLYEGREPVFDAYGIEDEIGRALSRKVPLRSGGHLIIDQAEALTAIDVNTGRFVGKGSKDLEQTILQTNLEAVEEIAYQLRFRNIGGLIILDLIDMEKTSNREKVRRRLEELLAKDKAKTTLNRISDLGLIEMTRKRTRESLGRLLHEPCFYCDGTGQLQSKQTIAYEILRQIRREMLNLKGFRITVNAHPAIIDLLKNEEREAVRDAERMFTRRIELVARREYHIEQFDLQGL